MLCLSLSTLLLNKMQYIIERVVPGSFSCCYINVMFTAQINNQWYVVAAVVHMVVSFSHNFSHVQTTSVLPAACFHTKVHPLLMFVIFSPSLHFKAQKTLSSVWCLHHVLFITKLENKEPVLQGQVSGVDPKPSCSADRSFRFSVSPVQHLLTLMLRLCPRGRAGKAKTHWVCTFAGEEVGPKWHKGKILHLLFCNA